MDNKSCVVFDLDDVLIDTESNLDWLFRALRKTLSEYGIKNSEENISKIHSKNLHGFYKACRELNVEPEEFWQTRNNYYVKEKIKAIKNREISTFTDVDSILDLKDRYKLAILSDSPQEIVELFVEEFGFEDLFECIIGRGSSLEDLKKLKPSYHPFNRLMKNMHCKKLFYVGHSKRDRQFAENNGLKFILLDRRNNNRGFDSLNKVVDYLLTL
ncbi:MAG: HAD hydrolase-like protein [Candidatus Thermoplasmatota archaeon]